MIIVAVIGNTDSTDSPDCVTDTSEYIRFYKFIFFCFSHFLIPCGALSDACHFLNAR